MTLSEKILLFLSKTPDLNKPPDEEWNSDNALSILNEHFPEFEKSILGKRIVDFGCGNGFQSIAFSQRGAKKVVGIDSNLKNLDKARKLLNDSPGCSNVDFKDQVDQSLKGNIDLVISQDSFEHFEDPAGILSLMKTMLAPNGKILITFGPPWYAPYGVHMFFFIRVPWANLIFSEKTILNVRSKFRNDGATCYEEVEGGLNKMTIAKFDALIRNCGLRTEFVKYDCIKGLNFLSRIPLLRELTINHISCVLSADKLDGKS